MANRIASFDWSSTPLGGTEGWPDALKTTLSLVLSAQAQIVLFWGSERIAFYNDAYAPTIGDKHPKALGRPARESWAELWDDLGPLLDGVWRSGETFAADDRPFQINRRGYLEAVWFDISYQAVRDALGEVLGILCIVRETTRTVRTQQRLQFLVNLTDRIRTLQEPDAILGSVAGMIGEKFHADRVGFAEISATGDAVTVSGPWSPAGSPVEAPLGPDEIAALEPHGRLTPDGLLVPLSRGDRVVAALFVQNSDPHRRSADDVALLSEAAERGWAAAERARAEQAVVASEARVQAIVNSIDQMIWSTLPDGSHDYFNQRWYEFTGVPEGSTDGEGWNGVFHPEDQPRAWEVWRASLASGAPYYIEYRLRHRSGAYRWVIGRAHSVRDVTGRIVRWYGTCTDVHDLKTAEAALRDLNETLESRVAAAVEDRENAEEALRQAQKMETLGQLTGGVAHDFNNLLQIVVGNLETLNRNLPAESPRLKRAAENAMTGAKRATTLTQRLLAFSRRQPLAPRPIEPNRLVAGMADLLARTIGETIELEAVQAGGLWRVEADPNQLENAILNLAVNARDAMPGGGKLTIETANTHFDRGYADEHIDVLPGQYVMISVSDTGVGMEPATVSRAFEPFFTTKDVGKGTGLGLSMVYGFVKQSGGHVKIYSEPGHGTTVKIYLPRLVGETAEEAPPPQPLAPEGSHHDTILVVEDDDDVRMYSVEALRELGYRVLEAHDGASALRLLARQEGEVDLLFTDVVLSGGMNGAEIAREARALRPNIKVLFTTGYARNAIVHHGRLDPGVQLITKPFAYADLAARVRDILDGG